MTLRGFHCSCAMAIIAGCSAPRAATPSNGDLHVEADASADRAHPASVRLELAHGELRLGPCANEGHTLWGTVHTADATLMPHLTVNRRGIALVQDFTPDDAAPPPAWDLALGPTPVRLDVHVVSSEDQHVDLGGCAVTSARFYNEGGHLDLRWTTASANVAERIELWSIGYLEARDVSRSKAKRVEVKNVGFATIDLGDRVEQSIVIDVPSSAGTLVIDVPRGVAATAIVDTSAHVEAEGWEHPSPERYVLGPGEADALVKIAVHMAPASCVFTCTESQR